MQLSRRGGSSAVEPAIGSVSSAAVSTRYRYYALFVLTLVFTSSHVDRQIIGILLEPIKHDLGASDTQMGFLVGLTFAIFYATLGMPIAMWADRGNRRNIIGLAVAVWSGMTLLCGLAGSFVQLALARIGVGVGEAGSNPPSHSMISDLFGPAERSTAMSFFAVGINVGLLIAYLGGGWMSDHWGWRTSFMVVGAPGLAIALLVRFTLVEPPRGAADGGMLGEDAPGFWSVAAHIWRTPALRQTIVAGSLSSFVGYGLVLWLPAFFARSHGLSQTEVGLTLAVLMGVVSGAGTFLSGRIADRLARRDLRWNLWIVALANVIALPFAVAALLADSFPVAFALYCVPAFLGGFYLGPTFSMVQGLAPVRMRAVTAAINLFIANLIGLGAGPQLVGVLSDALKPAYGIESLRYALVAFVAITLWAAAHYYLASRHLRQGLAAARGG